MGIFLFIFLLLLLLLFFFLFHFLKMGIPIQIGRFGNKSYSLTALPSLVEYCLLLLDLESHIPTFNISWFDKRDLWRSHVSSVKSPVLFAKLIQSLCRHLNGGPNWNS